MPMALTKRGSDSSSFPCPVRVFQAQQQEEEEEEQQQQQQHKQTRLVNTRLLVRLSDCQIPPPCCQAILEVVEISRHSHRYYMHKCCTIPSFEILRPITVKRYCTQVKYSYE